MTPKQALIYPQKQETGRAQSRPQDSIMGGPVSRAPRSQARASRWHLPSIPGYPSTGRGPPPVSVRTQKRHQDFSDLGSFPRPALQDLCEDFLTSRMELRWHITPVRNLTSVRLMLGLRKLPQASRSLQTSRIRKDTWLSGMCQATPGGADQVLITPPPSGKVVSCVAVSLSGHQSKGGCHTLPL